MFAVFLLIPSLLLQSHYPLPETDKREYIIRQFTVKDGLPVNSVNGMLQDEHGYIYFSTLDGLAQFDGYGFRIFNAGNTPGIQSNRFMGVIDAQTGLWTLNGGGTVTRKTDSAFRTYGQAELPGMVIRILEDTAGTVWVAGTEGLAAYEASEDRFRLVEDSLMATHTWALGADRTGRLIAVNGYGLVVKEGEVSRLLLPAEDFPIDHEGVIQVVPVTDDHIWVTGAGGAFRFNREQKNINFEFTSPAEQLTIWNITQTDRHVYTFTGNNGFYRFDESSQTIRKLPLQVSSTLDRVNLVFEGNYGEEILVGDDEVIIDGEVVLRQEGLRSAMVDREGSLWVSTYADGVFQIRRSWFVNITDSDIPGFINIYPVIQTEDGAVWAGSFMNGIFRLGAGEVKHWSSANSILPNNIVRFLFEDAGGEVYAGLFEDEGLWKYENDRWYHFPVFQDLFGENATVEAMHRQGDRLYIGSTRSLVVYEDGAFRIFDPDNPKAYEKVRVIREAGDGRLMMGTNGKGIFTLTREGTVFYTAGNGALKSNFIRDIYIQSRDTVWVATENLGLSRLTFDAAGTLATARHITRSDGLISNSLHRIIEDRFGYLWISTNSGIMRISKQNLNAYADGERDALQLLAFDENDGMTNREANGGVQTAGLLAADERIWFPNQKGVNILDPAVIESEREPVAHLPVIESVVLSDSTIFVDSHSEIVIPAYQRNLRIMFTAPNFLQQDRVRFRYRLEEAHNDWQPGSQAREAVLTNIPPGKHTFRVETLYLGEPVSQASLTLVLPHRFYEKTEFYIFVFVVLSALIYGGFRYRVRHLQRRERMLKKMVDEQTEELRRADEQKSQFFTGITHELKTPLSLILGPLDDIVENRAAITDEKLSARLSMMQRNARKLQQLVHQVLDVSKLKAEAIQLTLQPSDICRLTQQVAGQFHSRLEQQSISLEFSADQISEYIYIDHQAWERIMFNLLSNAIKYSPEGGTIWLEIRDLGDRISVTVRDEGVGIDQEEHEKVFEYLYQTNKHQMAEGTGIGLFLVKGLTEHMGGSVTLNSETGDGAAFTVILKKGYGHFGSEHRVLHDPLVPVEEEKNLTPNILPDSKEGSEEGQSAESARILLVEDNQDFREYLGSVLSEKYHVLAAANGKAALDLLEDMNPDLIISDVMMPEMDGLEFVRTLRGSQKYEYLPVIFLSAKDQERDMEAGLSTGADVYLPKPIHSKMLLAQIAAVLRREKILKSRESAASGGEEPLLVTQIRQIVYRQLGNPSLSVSMLAEALFMSRTKLYNEWKKVSDVSLNDFIKSMRLSEAKVLLKDRGFTVQEAAYAVGYSDPNYFSTSFKKEFGCSPSTIKG